MGRCICSGVKSEEVSKAKLACMREKKKETGSRWAPYIFKWVWLTPADISHTTLESMYLSFIKMVFVRAVVCYCFPVCAHPGTHLNSAFVSPSTLNRHRRRTVKTYCYYVPSLYHLFILPRSAFTHQTAASLTEVLIFFQLWLTGLRSVFILATCLFLKAHN